MSQFRTTADILDEILERAGESSGGNSPYETSVLKFANKVHHAIIGGGNLLSLKVDEAWTWARARFPFALDLKPAYITGTVSMVEGDVNFTFSDAPTSSLEGWFLQVTNKPTIYRIMQHSASALTGVIDSAFVDDGAAYAFRAFKLEYDLVPSYMYVDSTNDKIDFVETGSTQISATLTHGSYTPAQLIAHVATKLSAAGTCAYSGSYDSVLRNTTITSDLAGGKIFTLLGATGTNRRRSALPLLGYDRLDLAAASADSAGSYVGKYVVNGISRLIEPFKVFMGASCEPHILSTDLYNMEMDSPLAYCQEKIPDKFAKVSEASDGTYVVRFNAYPNQRTKVLVDWIPVPIDLQDNASSVPLIPRKDLECLISGAAMFIAFEKSDDKYNAHFTMAKAQLEAMEKKNRSELFRTGPNFAQLTARPDLVAARTKLNYGYTASGATGVSTETAQTMIPITLTYANFQTGALTNTVTARTLPGNRMLSVIVIKHSVAFAGGAISSVRLDVGISGDDDKFITQFSVSQAVSDSAQDSSLAVYYPAAATGITVKATAVGANLSALSAGSVTLYFSEQVVP